MPAVVRARLINAWKLVAHSLSGRLLIFTLAYVLISETALFLPSVGRYHRELLDNHIESAELAILPFTEAGGRELSDALRGELLERAGAAAVLLRRADKRELFLVSAMPEKIDVTTDLTGRSIFGDMRDALDCLSHGGNRVLHVISPTKIPGAQSIGILLGEAPIRTALLAYAERVIVTGLIISIVTALLVFASLYLIFVRPMARLTRAMVAFRLDPEDASRIVSASARRDEIGTAERELAAMQSDLYASLQQKTRLAALGAALARIQHDLKNILSTAQLASDRLSSLDDPVVKRLTPRLVASIDRAVALATSTLRYGRAHEAVPRRKRVRLAPLVAEACEAATETRGAHSVACTTDIDTALEIDADLDHLHRIILNLVRNAVEAICAQGKGEIRVCAQRRGKGVHIDILDTGPGIPPDMRERLFQPFAGSLREGGSGLGLAIARDLARAHGGDVLLMKSSESGTVFRIEIPDRETI